MLNERLRKTHNTGRRQTLDGVVGAPVRQGAQPSSVGNLIGSRDSFRSTSGRSVDSFKRREGFHTANRPEHTGGPRQGSVRPGNDKTQGSLLHMTLPGGSLHNTRKRRDNRPKSKWRTFRTWGLRSALACGAIVLLLGGFLLLKGYLSLNKVFKGGGDAAALQSDVDPSLLRGEGDGRVNILLLGRGGEGHDGADLTDTILLASVDPVNKKTALVSIPRDLWVSAPNSGSSKINAVFANAKQAALRNTDDKQKAEEAGIKAAQEVVKEVLGVPIHYYGMVDFKAFEDGINTIGGVTVNVPEDLVDRTMAWENNGDPVLAHAGEQTFDGRKALMYVRSRHGSARGDFDRTERQRLLITATSQKVLSANTFTNPVKISNLLDNFGSHVATDFSVNDGLRLMEIIKDVGDDVESIGLADPPNEFLTTGFAGSLSIVRPVEGIGNYDAIHTFIRSKLKDGYIVKENAKVVVLNGTTISGEAGKKADELKSYGYNVTKVDDAPTQDYAETIIVDRTHKKKPYTRNYLEKRFDVKAVSQLPDDTIQAENADFVIILGR